MQFEAVKAQKSISSGRPTCDAGPGNTQALSSALERSFSRPFRPVKGLIHAPLFSAAPVSGHPRARGVAAVVRLRVVERAELPSFRSRRQRVQQLRVCPPRGCPRPASSPSLSRFENNCRQLFLAPLFDNSHTDKARPRSATISIERGRSSLRPAGSLVLTTSCTTRKETHSRLSSSLRTRTSSPRSSRGRPI